MTTCQVEQRRRAEHAAAVLQGRSSVLDVATVGPGEDPTDHWLVDVALDDAAEGLPADLCADIGHLGLTVRHVGPQGPFWTALLQV